jgi:hypothetical protein
MRNTAVNPLQIVINKDGYEIHDQEESRSLVSNIRRMDEALHIFRELTSSSIHPPAVSERSSPDWFVVPGILVS